MPWRISTCSLSSCFNADRHHPVRYKREEGSKCSQFSFRSTFFKERSSDSNGRKSLAVIWRMYFTRSLYQSFEPNALPVNKRLTSCASNRLNVYYGISAATAKRPPPRLAMGLRCRRFRRQKKYRFTPTAIRHCKTSRFIFFLMPLQHPPIPVVFK